MRSLLTVLLVLCYAARAADRPNILLIVSDDQGYLDNLGRKRVAETKRDAEIGEAEAARDAMVRSAEARRLDARGTTIAPGLIDTHAHLHYSAFETFPETKWEYAANLAYGVTTAVGLIAFLMSTQPALR